MKTRMLTAAILTATFGAVPTIAIAQEAPTCKALVQISNDFYLVDPPGKVTTRFTNDGRQKRYAALSPGGDRLAFVTAADSSSFIVADAMGNKNRYSAAKPSARSTADDAADPSNVADAPLVGLLWTAGDTLRLEKHIAKNNSRFEFYRVSARTAELQQVASPAVGETCAVAGATAKTACLQGSDVVVDNTIVYSDTGAKTATQLAPLTLRVGTSAPLENGLQVEVKSLQDGVTLRVTLPNGNWSQSRVSGNDFMSVLFEGKTLRIYPTITDTKRGLVALKIHAGTENSSDRSALTWGPRNLGLMVASEGADRSRLTYLIPTPSGKWQPLGQASFNAAGITSLRFVRPNILYVEDRSGFRLLPALLPSSTDSKLFVGTTAVLPNALKAEINGASVQAKVVSWNCQ